MSRNLHVLLGDLTHLSEANSQNYYVPLNVGYLAACAKKRFGAEVAVEVFKDPKAMLERARSGPVDVVGLASYYWNNLLNDAVAKRIKAEHPRATFVAGGPSIDSDTKELGRYVGRHSWIDFAIPNEGEDAFSSILTWRLGDCRQDVPAIGMGLSTDLAEVPSPWLDGTLDAYVNGPWQPLVQTSRLCPYTCSFCVSGKSRGKLRAFPMEQVNAEIDYVARHFAALGRGENQRRRHAAERERREESLRDLNRERAARIAIPGRLTLVPASVKNPNAELDDVPF